MAKEVIYMPVRRRGIVGTMARTAVIAGTATAVSNNVTRRQMRRQQPQEPAEPAQAAPQDDITAELEKLNDLKEKGLITQEDFDAKKKQLLGL